MQFDIPAEMAHHIINILARSPYQEVAQPIALLAGQLAEQEKAKAAIEAAAKAPVPVNRSMNNPRDAIFNSAG